LFGLYTTFDLYFAQQIKYRPYNSLIIKDIKHFCYISTMMFLNTNDCSNNYTEQSDKSALLPSSAGAKAINRGHQRVLW
jgi:hypothetical protein